MINIDLFSVLFLDIETASCVRDFSELSDVMKKQWMRKCGYLIPARPSGGRSDEKVTEETAANLFRERAAIYSEFGKVICISLGSLVKKDGDAYGIKLKSIYGEDETKILREAAEIFSKKPERMLCAHNGKEFDFPYLARRMLINEISVPGILQTQGKKPWEVNHLDTLELWKFGDKKAYTGLELLAAVLNITTPKTDLDGSMVSRVFWEEKDLERIKNYCQRDVLTVAQILLKFSEKKLIEEKKVMVV